MSATTLPLRARARHGLADLRALVVAHRVLWPAAGLVVATVVAYHFTLGSLFDFLRLDTPLAYLPLLPFFTLGLALSAARRYQGGPPPIADRQVDLIIGLPLLLVAVVMITVLPALQSTYYWVDRPDVLSLALFVSAGVIILYGVNWFWRIRAAVAFLVLMWPALYIHFLPSVMDSFTSATNSALGAVVAHLPLGITADPSNSGLLSVHPAHQAPIQVSVGSACSGANSVLGFALIGGALLCTTGGRRIRKVAWFVAGLLLVFVLNVLRLTSILSLATAGYPSLALGGYHAVIGLILFAIAVAVMMRLLPVFGLHPRSPVPAKPGAAAPASRVRRPRPWRRLTVAAAAIGAVGFVALADHQLLPYASFLDGTGSPTVPVFGQAALPAGVTVGPPQNFAWAKQYFGENSSFDRFYLRDGGASTVFADVVRTDDRGALDAYGLQNCFLFHDYAITTSSRVDLGGGVTGLLLNYTDPNTKARWATVSWAWPIRYQGDTYYERVALTADLSASGSDANFQPDGNGLRGFLVGLLNRTSDSIDDSASHRLYQAADGRLEALGARLVRSSVQGTAN